MSTEYTRHRFSLWQFLLGCLLAAVVLALFLAAALELGGGE
jgi:hypothetical protein